MAQDFQPVRRVAGNDRDGRVAADECCKVARLPIDLDRNRRLGEAGSDCRRNFSTGSRLAKIKVFAVRQGYDNGA
jgi:hypothetical protein